jgi:hypothetical protein
MSVFCGVNWILKNLKDFFKNNIFMFLDCFDMLMSKIIFKK